MNKDLMTFLFSVITDQRVVTAITTLFLGGISFALKRLSAAGRKAEESRTRRDEDILTIKRSLLRGEYLSIYNSDNLTIKEKYVITRKIYDEYKKINGNHYIDMLDLKLTNAYKREGENGK